MSRILWRWLLGAADDTAQAAMMLVLAGVVVRLDTRQFKAVKTYSSKAHDERPARRSPW